MADIGCGFGFLALHLAAHGTAVTACDIDPGTTRLLRRMAGRLGHPLRVVTGDARPRPAGVRLGGRGGPAARPGARRGGAAAALISEATRIARHRVVVAVPYETQPTRLFGHLRTINAGQLRKLGAGSGWDYRVYEHHGGWLVLDRPGSGPAAAGQAGSAAMRRAARSSAMT